VDIIPMGSRNAASLAAKRVYDKTGKMPALRYVPLPSAALYP
jgi:hypothetical protein